MKKHIFVLILWFWDCLRQWVVFDPLRSSTETCNLDLLGSFLTVVDPLGPYSSYRWSFGDASGGGCSFDPLNGNSVTR